MYITEVAKLAGMNRRTIERRLAAGTFPKPVRLTRGNEWSETAVRRWLDEAKPEPLPAFLDEMVEDAALTLRMKSTADKLQLLFNISNEAIALLREVELERADVELKPLMDRWSTQVMARCRVLEHEHITAQQGEIDRGRATLKARLAKRRVRLGKTRVEA